MSRNIGFWSLILFLPFFLAPPAQAAFVLEIDTDGADDGVVTYNPGFFFGGDTTTASQSAASAALGLTGGDSIFGGDGITQPDTYIYQHGPDTEADNYTPAAGTDLGGGNLATGLTGGGAGIYAVYATWPYSTNVSGVPIQYSVASADDSFMVAIDQNDKGDNWVLLGTLSYTSGAITVTQTPSQNTFVSQRAAGILFEFIRVPVELQSFTITELEEPDDPVHRGESSRPTNTNRHVQSAPTQRTVSENR